MALKYLSISNLSTVWTKIKAYLSANYQPKGSYLTSHQDISGLETKANAITGLSVSGTTITYTKGNGTTGTITTQDTNTTYSKLSQFTNDSGYITSSGSCNYANSAGAVAWANVSGKPSSFTPSSHTHDDRYYTESEIDTKLGGKSNTDHTHSNYLTGITKAMVTTALGYTPPTSDTNTWNALKGSTTSAAGTAGYAPAPAAGAANRYLRCDGTWQVPPDNNTTYSFSNKAATLAWNTTSTIATVGGVDITVKLPANPNTNTTYSAGSNLSLSGTTFNVSTNPVFNAIELSSATPYIDFHYGSSTADFTARMIADTNNRINVYATGGLRIDSNGSSSGLLLGSYRIYVG